MLVSEAKTGLMKWADEIIGVWFPNNKFIGAAAKVALGNMWDKHQDMVTMLFADKNGHLTIDSLIDQLAKDFIPEQGLDLKSVVGDNSISKFVGGKIIEREDLYKLKKILENGNINKNSSVSGSAGLACLA